MNKIVHIVHWERSGIYSVAKELAVEGKKAGDVHEIFVIRRSKGGLDLFLSFFRMTKLLLSVLFRKNVFFHAHSFLPFLFMYFIKGAGAITFHNLYPYFSSSNKKDRLKRLIICKLVKHRSIRTSSVGRGVADAVLAGLHIASTVIFNGLRAERYSFSLPSGHKVVGTAGRLDDQKNYETLISAFAQCKDKSLVLKIAGEGVKRPILEKLISDLNLGARVQLLGHQNDMIGFYQGIDVFVCSSLYEGFGMVVAEAMFSGKSVISTNVGIALDFDDVRILRCGFDPEDITRAIDEWTQTSHEDIASWAHHNRVVALDNFTIGNVYRQYANLIWAENR